MNYQNNDSTEWLNYQPTPAPHINTNYSSPNGTCVFCFGEEKSHMGCLLKKLRVTNQQRTVTLVDLDQHIETVTAKTSKPMQKQVEEFINQLAVNCRIVTHNQATSTDFSSRLEMNIRGNWVTLLSYDCHHGLAFRYVYAQDGRAKPCQLDLPPSVIKQMSQEDFSRNWAQYCKTFVGGQRKINSSD